MPQQLYLAIDIEKAGDRFSDPILMIGTCLGDDQGNVIETRAFCGPVPKESDFQPRCYESFWRHHLDVLERIRSQRGGKNFIDRFMEYYFDLDKRYLTAAITLLSDNPAYDLSNIDLVLATKGHGDIYLYPLRYSSKGAYRSVTDPSEIIGALPEAVQKRITAAVAALVPHDHWAENDATEIYHLMMHARAYLNSRREESGAM